jgi:hypothetical protein
MPLAAAIIPAIATVGAAVLGSNAANSAAKTAAAAQGQATAASLAAQQAALDRITQLNQPFISAGAGVLPQIASRVAAGPPNFSASSYAQPFPGGTQTQALQDRATGTPIVGEGTPMPKSGAVPISPIEPQAQPQATGPDWDAYIAANPDVAAWIQQGHGDPSLGPNQTPEQAAAYQFHNTGQSEGRTVPTLHPAQATPGPGGTPATPPDLGTASPVVANYTRPDQPATPNFGPSPDAASYLNGANFTASPGYQWRLQQGQRNLNANFGARGLLQSGSAIQGAIDYGQNQASSEYGNWFNQQQQLYADKAGQYNTDRASGLNQFNLDRNNTNNNFAEDRSYGTNLAVNNRDFANSQYNTQTQNLFQLAGVGANAAAAIGGANNTYANNASNLFVGQGNNQADAAYNRGSSQQQLYGTVGSTVANLFSSPSRYTGGTPLPLQTSAFSAPTYPGAPNAFATNLTQVPSYSYAGGY